jgi:uncharacterized membrane protein YphA (DoxX/SURF4 family)
MENAMSIVTWIVRALLALAFVSAGAAKLIGVEAMVMVFDQIGVGQWFRYLTGLIEVAGAILVVTPAFGLLGALLLACTMVGAVLSHLVLIGGSAIPALVLGLLAGFVVYRLRGDVDSLRQRLGLS